MMLDDIESKIRTVHVTRYIMPFKEGGSLPGLAEADDCFEYVLKFRGAGQGTRALIADFLGGEIARLLDLKIPELVFAEIDEAFGQSEPDEEIQDLLKASRGLNLGVHFLSKAITFDAVATYVSPELAAKIVWLDAYLMNIDRTVKNTNMLVWNKELWLIDHGASLYFHHNMENWKDAVSSPFTGIQKHVLLYHAKNVAAVDAWAKTILTHDIIQELVDLIPEVWLDEEGGTFSNEEKRKIYFEFLTQRLQHSEQFVKTIAAYEK